MHETWMAPGGAAAARIDYHSVPNTWHVGPGGSYVQFDVDTGHASVDHLAVALEVWVPGSGSSARAAAPPSLDRGKMSTPEGQQIIRSLCDSAPLLPWSLDADSRFATLQNHLFKGLVECFPRPKHCKPGSFLSEATWVLRAHRIWLRKQTALLRSKLRRFEVLVAFKGVAR